MPARILTSSDQNPTQPQRRGAGIFVIGEALNVDLTSTTVSPVTLYTATATEQGVTLFLSVLPTAVDQTGGSALNAVIKLETYNTGPTLLGTMLRNQTIKFQNDLHWDQMLLLTGFRPRASISGYTIKYSVVTASDATTFNVNLFLLGFIP